MTMTDTPTVATSDGPRAWVGCLGCYNGGNLVGRWLDDPDAIRAYRCPRPATIYNLHEELWVFDHEGLPFLRGETSPDEFARLAEAYTAVLDETGLDAEIVDAYIDNVGIDYVDWDTLADEITDSYAGAFDDLADYAYELAHETTENLDAHPFATYIDWEAVGRDARLSGDVWTHETGGTVHVFRNIH